MSVVAEELSLLSVYNRLIEDENDYGSKIRLLYDLYKANEKLPHGVTNTFDSPELWPDNGVNIYNVVETYGLSKSLCTTGVIVNFASLKYKFQFMLVKENILEPSYNGQLLLRYAKNDTNGDYVWTSWKPFTGNGVGVDINLEGDITGQVTDIDLDTLTITTSAGNRFLPFNFHLRPTNYTTKTYFKLCTLPAQSSLTHNYVTIQGHIGTKKSSQCKAYVNITASNSNMPAVYGVALGKLNNSINIIAVTNSNNELELYLSVLGETDTCDLSIYGSQVEINNTSTVTAPTGKQIWSLNDDAAVITNKVTNISSDEYFETRLTELENRITLLEQRN